MTDSLWNRLSDVNIEKKETYQKIFTTIVQQVQNNTFHIVPGETEHKDYFLVTEENRMGAYFLHIVPKELYSFFKELQIKAPHQFLGFSVLAGKHNGKEVRVSCFGVQCNILAKSLIKSGMH